jgi:hypothetical protein
MVLSRGEIVLAPKEAQEGDELCMFYRHNSAIVLREIPPGEWVLIGNAFVFTTAEKKRRPREKLRSLQYCLPDHDVFLPRRQIPKRSFLFE